MQEHGSKKKQHASVLRQRRDLPTDILKATCEPVFGGFYYTRGERDCLPDAVLNSPEAAAAAVGHVATPDGPLLRPVAAWWFPISDRRFTPLGNSRRGLNDFLNRVLGYPDARFPAIDPWSEG